MLNRGNFVDLLDTAINQWQSYGNQETEDIRSYLYPVATREFLEYEEVCKREVGIYNLMDYGIGCDLLENYLEAIQNGSDPLQGWRFRLHKALNRLTG